MSYYKNKLIITDHAIQRFIERNKTKMNRFEAQNQIVELINNSFPINISEDEKHYEINNSKMIFVVINNKVVTFKPNK